MTDILDKVGRASRFYTIDAEWPALGDGTIVGQGDLRKWLRALVAEVERLREQNARNIGLLEVCEDLGVQLEAEKQRHAALRQRHAAAVEKAFRAGYSAGGDDMSAAHHNEYYVGEDAAWLASEVKANLGGASQEDAVVRCKPSALAVSAAHPQPRRKRG